jgi:molybdate transport system substrate-binding protein
MRGWLSAGVGLLLSTIGASVDAAEIRVFSGGALQGIIGDLSPAFERATGSKIILRSGATGAMRREIEGGAPFDLALLDRPVMEALVKQGKVLASGLTPFARVGMGLGVRAGAKKPDIKTVETFKAALLGAASVAYAPEGTVGSHLPTVFERLGIASEMKAKSKLQPNAAAAGKAVASGEAEVVLAVTNNIVAVKGVELAGSFPETLQYWVVVTAGLASSTQIAGEVRAFLKHLKSPEAEAVIRKRGMEPASG